MSSLLPVLASDPPQMELCNVCPKPGVCCNNFILGGGEERFPVESWRENAEALLVAWGLPFTVLGERTRIMDADGEHVVPEFGCTHVTGEGRCGIYNERPATCRTFVPGTDELCAFHHLHHAYRAEVAERYPE